MSSPASSLSLAGQYYSALPTDALLQSQAVTQPEMLYATPPVGAQPYQAVELAEAAQLARTSEVLWDLLTLFSIFCRLKFFSSILSIQFLV